MSPWTTLDNPLILIGGCPRSGTTWMGQIFQQHPRVLYSQESAIFDLFTGPWWDLDVPDDLTLEVPPPGRLRRIVRARGLDLLQAVLMPRPALWVRAWRRQLIDYFGDRKDFILQHSGIARRPTIPMQYKARMIDYPSLCGLIAAVEDDTEASHEEKERRVAHGIFRHFLSRHDGAPEHVLVEKSPGNLLAADKILELFPRAKMIEMLRDGRDVCVSMDSYSDRMPSQREVQILFWTTFAEKGLALKENPKLADRVLTVRFEELKRDPAAEIRRVFDFARVELSPGQAQEIAKATHIRKMKDIEEGRHFGEGKHFRKGVVGDWRERFSGEDVERFKQRAGEIFDRLGYEW